MLRLALAVAAFCLLLALSSSASAGGHVSPLAPPQSAAESAVSDPECPPMRARELDALIKAGTPPAFFTLEDLSQIREDRHADYRKAQKIYYAAVAADLVTTAVALNSGLREGGIVNHNSRSAVRTVALNAAISTAAERFVAHLHHRNPYSPKYAKALRIGGYIRFGVAGWNVGVTLYTRSNR